MSNNFKALYYNTKSRYLFLYLKLNTNQQLPRPEQKLKLAQP